MGIGSPRIIFAGALLLVSVLIRNPSFIALWTRRQAEDYRFTQERREIIELLKKSGGPWKLKDIAEALGKGKPNVSNLLAHLVEQGAVEKVGYGKYALKSESAESGEPDEPAESGERDAGGLELEKSPGDDKAGTAESDEPGESGESSE